MIKIGLTGWGDHDQLYQNAPTSRNKLHTYSSHFPIVEIDSSFYAIQSIKNYDSWVQSTPDTFSFIVKAFQGMTGHTRGESSYESNKAMFDAFIESISPLKEAGKLKAILFQFPPWFDCTKKHVDVLRYTREKIGDHPVALEFRNQTWFTPEMREKTLDFMRNEGWIHSVCDEPQAGVGSIPIVLSSTHRDLTVVRFHGRNVHGWRSSGQPNWREVRYLYRYSKEELIEWKERLLELLNSSKEICVVFNNNSGGDAADNAKQMIKLLGIEYEGLHPMQLELF